MPIHKWAAVAALVFLAGACGPAEDAYTTGTVKWFNDQKGFGFITPDSGGRDAFVHHSEIVMPGFKTLAEGQRVRFILHTDPKGPRATDVQPLTDERSDTASSK